MQKLLTVGVIAAAFVATLTFGGDGSLQNEPAAAQAGDIAPAVTVVNAPVYSRVPRIIHVPQADDREEEAAPPPRRRVAPAPRMQEPRLQESRPQEPRPQESHLQEPRVQDDIPRPRAPRWQLRSDAPPPPPQGPRRAILSAPPLPAEGPTPIRPTPRFGVKADATDKFAAPREND